MDQYSVYYSFGRRSVTWRRKLMFWLMEVALVNSFILYKTTVDKPISHANYRRKLIAALCEGLPTGHVRWQLIRPSKEEERFGGQQYLEQGSSPCQCIVCNDPKKGKRHDTIYYCKTCSCYPPLHVDVCFEQYHDLINYKL